MKNIFYLFYYIILFGGFLVIFSSCYGIGTISSLLLFYCFIKKIGTKFGTFSLPFLFLLFFGLYGYCVPISVICGLDIGEYRLDYISTWSDVDETLISFSLINHIALVSMIISYIVFSRNTSAVVSITKKQEYKDREKNTFVLSYILGIFSSLFEFVNFIRVGGITTLLSGKLAYQSSQADAGLMLPSEIFFYLAVAAFAYSSSLYHLSKKKTILFFVSIFFYITVNLIIGERGTFVNALIMFLLGYNFYFRLFKVKCIYVIVGVVVYFIFAVVTVYRSVFDAGLEVSVGDAVDYVEDRKELLVFVLNPANSEFCTSTLNYRVFLDRHKHTEVEYKYGYSYIHFYSQLLPQKINPLYDISETIKFRDKYFPERAKGGSTGGTAYSSMYEAYVNWWYYGGVIVYFIIFYVILFIEKKCKETTSLYLFFVYVLSFELVLLFHRSAFEYIVVKLFALLFYSFFAVKLNSLIQLLKKY